MKKLLEDYSEKKKAIKNRLKEFRQNNKDIYSELCFCILTPQAKAVVCDKAIKRLQKKNLLLRGSEKDIRPHLNGVRFPNNKAKYLIAARNINVKEIDTKDLSQTRDWLVKNVKGFGYKEASHFLRNIGYGKGLAILDRHILKNLKKYGIIKLIPATLSRKNYLDIEGKMKDFFGKLNIPIEEVDLLFWSNETGFIFK